MKSGRKKASPRAIASSRVRTAASPSSPVQTGARPAPTKIMSRHMLWAAQPTGSCQRIPTRMSAGSAAATVKACWMMRTGSPLTAHVESISAVVSSTAATATASSEHMA